MKRSVLIKNSSLPMRLPTQAAALWWLLLDRLGAPGWAYGVLWTVIGLAVIAFVYQCAAATMRDVPGFGDQK